MNFDRFRPFIAIASISILALTNCAYLLATSKGTVVEYSRTWDQPQIGALNLFLTGTLVVCAVIRPKQSDTNPQEFES